MPDLLFLSWRYWRKRPSLVLSMLFGLLLIMAFAPTLVTAAWQLGLRSNAFDSINADIRLVALSKEGSLPIGSRLPAYVKAQSSVLVRDSVLLNDEKQESVKVIGVEPQLYNFQSDLLAGRFLSDYDGRSLVISEALASSLKLELLDTVQLTSAQGFRTYRVIGISSERTSQIFMPLDEARLAFSSGQLLANWFDLELNAGSNVAEVARQLTTLFEQELTVLSSDSLKQQPSYTAQGLELFLLALALLTTLAALYLLFSNLSLMKLERRKELAVLGALGLAPQRARQLLYAEFLLLCVLAALLSLPLVKGLEHSLSILASSHVFSLRVTEFQLSLPRFLLVAAEFFLVLQVIWYLALTFPSNVANSRPNHKPSRTGFELPGSVWLSGRFFQLFRQQDALAFAFLVLSLATVSALFGLTGSYQVSLKALKERSETWDLLVYQRDPVTGISVPLEARAGDLLRQIGGVAEVASDTQMTLRQANLSANLLVSDAENGQFKTLSGVAGSHLALALQDGERVAVAKSLADLYGFEVGERLNLSTAKGKKDYQIIAIVDDSGAEPRGIYIDRKHFEADWRYHVVDYYSLILDETANQDRVMQQIKQSLGSRYLIDVIPASSIAVKAAAVMTNSFRLGQILSLCFVLIALLGFASVGKEKLYALKKKFRLLTYLGASQTFILKLFMGQMVIRTLLASLLSLSLGGLVSFLCIQALRYNGRYSINWVLPFQTYVYLLGLTAVVLLGLTLWSARALRKL